MTEETKNVVANKTNLKDMSYSHIGRFFEQLGEKPFRGRQVFSRLYKGVSSFEDIPEIPKALREKLTAMEQCGEISLGCHDILKKQTSQTDGTVKYLFGLEDGNTVESVFMEYKYGNSVCVSSQVGCRMGCAFCASTIGGLKRNLSAGEILEQIIRVQKDTGKHINHIVVMGMGEPFDNYNNLSGFLKLVNDPKGLNISMRNITVSTSGIIPVILQFAEDFPQVNLAISLHAVDNESRSTIMPVNKSYQMEDLIVACRQYTKITGRRITFEYALIKDVNDDMVHAEQLAKKLKNMLCHVNLIPLNKVEENYLEGSSRESATSFRNKLENMGIPATVRRELGADISAACGQLRLGNK